MDSIGIGTLAKRAGVSIDTVRYYERDGLLAPKTRLASGYRRYGEVELSREAHGAEKLTDVERRMAELERVRDGLKNLIEKCPGHGRAADCPILNALGDEELP